jgi:hypothetical protein
MKLFRIFFGALCVLIAPGLFAQSFPEDSITKKFDNWRKNAMQEKIYLRTDRGSYLTGELMWFKVYCVDGYNNRPLDLSKVVYVEMLNEENEPVLQRKIQMHDGIGSGSMFVPASLNAGNYKIRAYTNWMKNFGPGTFFHSTVTIVNTIVKPAVPVKSAPTYDAQFFPEGGDLVAGLRSKVGFRVTDKSGKGISFRGAILDERNDTVTRFKPVRFGIGSFEFTPSASKYRAVIVDDRGNRSTVALRDVKENGYVMKLTETADGITIDVSASAQENNFPVYLFVQCRQSIVVKDVRTVQQGKTSFRVKKSDLPAGITQFTLFDHNYKPTAERLFFTRPTQRMTIEGKTEIVAYNTRSRVKLKVNSSSNANVSVSVYKNDSIPSPAGVDLYEYLWLTSELKGNIESPEYYFNTSDTTVTRAIDNLMLTHGWRRFNWNDALNTKNTFAYEPEFRGHIIRGKVTDIAGQPANGILTYLSSPQMFVRTYGSRSTNKGDVQFEVKDFYGTKRIYVQNNFRLDSTYHIQVLNPFSEQYIAWPLPPAEMPSNISKQLLDRSVSMQVQDIYYRDQVNQFVPPSTDSLQFYGPADEVYNLDDYTRFPIMEEVLREYVPGVMVRKKKDGFHFLVIDKVNKSLFREDPMILIDGVPVFSVAAVMAFDPLKIKRLEVLSREYYEGLLSMPGVMSFFTYTGDLGGFPMDERGVSMNYDGVLLQREFYSPRYDNMNEKQARLPDPRTLLYWNPTVVIKAGETTEIEFYASDVPGNYTVVVEGLAKDGKAGKGVTEFSVSRRAN